MRFCELLLQSRSPDFEQLLQTVQSLHADVKTLKANNADLARLRNEDEGIGRLGESAGSVTKPKSTGSRSTNDRRQSSERVAFYTYLATTQEHIGIGQKIKFDAILLNDMNGYNPHVGAFVAPRAGLYMFSYTIAKTKAGKALVHLMHNGAAVNSAVVDVQNAYQYVQSGNVAIVRLNVGDVVYVEEYYQTDADISDYGNRWTTFSGIEM